MALTIEQKEYIQQVIANCLRNKFKNYTPKDNHSPFHFRLLGGDRMALHSFIHSILTSFGTSVFEPVAVALAKKRFVRAEAQYFIGDTIYSDCQTNITEIINKLTVDGASNKTNELKVLQNSLTGKLNRLKPAKADLFVENEQGEQYFFDLKTAKPNKGDFQEFKRTLLVWAGITFTANKDVKVHTLIGIPYNPYEPETYQSQSWTMKGMFDLQHELKVADEFWNFLGGEGTYTELLDCFEKAGVELRTEIDDYFGKFNRQ
jgi:type II restriction enzyme